MHLDFAYGDIRRSSYAVQQGKEDPLSQGNEADEEEAEEEEMKQDIADLKKRIQSVSSRMVPLMGQVNYAHRLLSHVKGLERIIEQLEREIEPMKSVRKSRSKKDGPDE